MNDSISFEIPFHPMVSSHQALLYSPHQPHSGFVDFDQAGLTQCPEVIISCGFEDKPRRYRYRGTSDGQAIYREES